MQIAVMGAGAVGCYFGARLAQAGHAVSLIGRASHVEAVQQHGLRLETAAGSEQVALAAATTPDAARGAALVLLCVKSVDTESAAAALLPYLAAQTQVLCLQNGIGNAERLRAMPGWAAVNVAPAVVYVAAEMAGPGHLLHRGRGDLVIGNSPHAAALQQMFSGAGVPVRISEHLASDLWAKLVLNSVYNALSAVVQQPYGALQRSPHAQALIDELLRECLDVAAAEGVTLPAEIETAVRRLPDAMPLQLSSTAQDLARGRASEIDYLNGYLVSRAAAHGLDVPINRCLLALVKMLEPPAQL